MEKQANQLPETMKVAVMTDIHKVELEERPVPSLGSNDVLVKVMAVGVCGSDVHYYDHGRIGNFVVEKPIILGHECAGVVAAVGEEVTRFKVGDRVAVEPGVTCGRCEYCKSGRYNLCKEVEFLATPPFDGSFAQYIKHREDFLFPLPDNMTFEEGALVEPFSVGIHACKRARVQPGSTVAILGMGPVGLMAVVAAKCFGAAQIYVTDIEPARLEAAKRLGATEAFNVKDVDAVAEIKRLTHDAGVDVAIETAGNPRALQTGLAAVRPGGALAIVGLPAQDEIPLNVPLISSYEIDIHGIFRYANTYPLGISFLASNDFDLNAVITDKYPLEQTQDALERALTNKSGSLKVMVYPNGQ
ncbi:NAD(P)-dependent alcohol dehydrogenase [Alicyclobacillus dauci]|uniref:NAD(P)-dependent alcohol dehydrogenase n=1 Tax=Alicyclobacillus dauci TaxID=1475485 RepID=A0ABY6Z532_9BACL|nr:NAD(P)-dependent alcohol dehydrogenase [Alicyclobacillus dauci]WAH37966.1 NAD(P)-dependent alcohol dehydrogenase [Alicyclobacillus dauci]